LIPKNPELGFSCAYIRVGYKQFRINRHFVFYQVQARINGVHTTLDGRGAYSPVISTCKLFAGIRSWLNVSSTLL
jgi:hypothetical protein